MNIGDFIEPYPFIDTSKISVDVDKLILLKTIEKKRIINEWENSDFLELLGSDLINFGFTEKDNQSSKLAIVASLTNYGKHIVDVSYENLSREDKKTIDRFVAKKLKRKFFWNNNLLT